MTVKKEEKLQLEGLKEVGEKENKKEVEDVIYTSPVKIGNKEYIIKPLSMLDIKKLNIERGNIKEGDDAANYDFTFFSLLAVIKKWNPEEKNLTVEEFEEMIDVEEFERVSVAIVKLAGLGKYFNLGDSGK
ncbi:MAG TPA: hypothetical protein VMV86_06500 [Methanosarcinales archaeon]|nr:hypothetical protein [Methanosarcinales archaeon]